MSEIIEKLLSDRDRKFNATELDGKTSDNYLQLGDDETGSTGAAPTINAGTFGGMTVGQFVDMIYPVGSIYMSANATSPASLFGGTWESIGGRFLLGADATYAAGSTGGEATHTLTVSEMPTHRHDSVKVAKNYLTAWASENSGSSNGFELSSLYKQNLEDSLNKFAGDYSGGGAAHNNMPPYLSVYMWQRTA